jgi:hypothetical protein
MDWPALIWTIATLICGRYNAVLWWKAVADYRWSESENGIPLERMLTARDQLMLHSILFAIQIDMLMVSAAVLVVPESPARRWMVVGGLMLIPIMLTVLGVWTQRNWLRIVRILEQKRKRRDASS